MTTCYAFLASRTPADLGPCWTAILGQTNLLAYGVATVAGAGCVLLVLVIGLRRAAG